MKIFTVPSVAPITFITLDEIKVYCRITHSHEDSLLQALLIAATTACENFARITIQQKEYKVRYAVPTISIDPLYVLATKIDNDNIESGIFLPRPPVVLVKGIVIVDKKGVETPFTEYAYNAEQNLIRWTNKDSLFACDNKELIVNYTAGFTNIPEEIKQAILSTVLNLYDRDTTEYAVSKLAITLLKPYYNNPSLLS